MAPSRIPYPDRGQGISFFAVRCLLPLSASLSGPGVSFLNVGMAESSGVEAGFQVLLPWQLYVAGGLWRSPSMWWAWPSPGFQSARIPTGDAAGVYDHWPVG